MNRDQVLKALEIIYPLGATEGYIAGIACHYHSSSQITDEVRQEIRPLLQELVNFKLVSKRLNEAKNKPVYILIVDPIELVRNRCEKIN